MVKGKSSYPTLALVAKDVLAIQVSTIASESAFSNSGRVIDPFRSSLTPKSVEALICLQNWLEVRILATLNIKLVRQNLTSIKIVSGTTCYSITFIYFYDTCHVFVNLLVFKKVSHLCCRVSKRQREEY